MAAARAIEAESPVGRLLDNERRQNRPISFGKVLTLLIVFGIAGVLIVTGVHDFQAPSSTTAHSEQQKVAVVVPSKVESVTSKTCRASDFVVEGFSSKVFDDCKQSSCPTLKLTGKLRNNCALSAGAQIKITAEDGKGSVIDTIDGWPASTRNVAPGATYAFDMGPLMVYRKGMKNFKIDIIDARIW
ncbi:hypothetical protein TM239_26430 [Bradyrhizobium sp. TM239]|nr:hypothetical protein TM239_26430 [Bradyrhizobium sp. TM239]